MLNGAVEDRHNDTRHNDTPLSSLASSGPAPLLRVLVVDDDPPVREACAEISASLGFFTETADSVPSARIALGKGAVDIVLLDLKLPGGGGLLLLEEIRSRHPAAVVVMMTAFATVNSAVEAMRVGAGDYLTKPFTLEELSEVLERAAQRRSFDAESRRLRERLRSGRGKSILIGRAPAMEKLYRILSKVAFTTHPVLILGESGTGKELIARSIHLNGPNAAKPFVPVDCASLAPTLLESELFGHVKGAFSGATRARTGLLASIDGGTVLLDEVAELPLDLQSRLLRALQEKAVHPIGAAHAVPLTARILAATNRDLEAMVETGRFRKDLFFRLNVVKLRIPPLRERKSDIPLLAAHILERLSERTAENKAERPARGKKQLYSFANDAMRLLMDYDWPGNVRELEHAIERACTLSSGPVLHLGDFPTQLQDAQHHLDWANAPQLATAGPAASGPLTLAAAAAPGALPTASGEVLSIAEMEKQAILNTLQQLKGDKLMAARLLGIGKTTLYRKLKEYGVGDDEV
jgi:two-component system response regulator HydG